MSLTDIFNELQRYVRFTDEDLYALRKFHAIASSHFNDIAAQFYERICEHEEAHNVFKNEEQIDRLHKSLVRWMHRLCTAQRDETYLFETAKIGRVHVKVGLPQRYVFSAMSQIRSSFEQKIQLHDRETEANAMRSALAKALDLELALMLETYRDDFVNRLRKIEEKERDELGRALAQTQHRYIHAVEYAPFLIVGINKDGVIILFNQLAERITGMSRDEVWNTLFVDTLMTEDAKQNCKTLLDSMVAKTAGHEQVMVGCELLTRSGRLRYIQWTFTYAPLQDAQSKDDVVIFVIGHDRTDEQAMEERTRQAEKLAAVGTLAAGLAHEIRNPLNGAQLHVTFLERSLRKFSINADILDSIQIVGDEIKRLSSLVNDFLHFARPKPLDRKLTVIQDLCKHTVQLLAGIAEQAGVTIELDLAQNSIELSADSAKLEQVLLNLMRNAIEAMVTTPQARLIVRVRRIPRHVILEVEDNGPGIPSPETPIFDAFFSTKSNGTGLGLPIVHRIVTDHGGTIDVQSKPGRTVFRISFPIYSLN